MTREDLRKLVTEIRSAHSESDTIEVKKARGGTPNGNAHKLQEDLTSLASVNMEPALRPQFTVDDIDGSTVVAVEIDEIPASQKPCFYKTAGLPKGAYLRVGNANRQMTEYEVFGYLSGKGQPTHDEDTVPDASLEDLDNTLIDNYLERLRQIRPRAVF